MNKLDETVHCLCTKCLNEVPIDEWNKYGGLCIRCRTKNKLKGIGKSNDK